MILLQNFRENYNVPNLMGLFRTSAPSLRTQDKQLDLHVVHYGWSRRLMSGYSHPMVVLASYEGESLNLARHYERCTP